MPSLVQTSKELGKVPRGLGAVDWIPVDVVARVVLEVVRSGMDVEVEEGGWLRVFNLLNPRRSEWSEMVDVVRMWYEGKGKRIEAVPFSEWIEAVAAVEPAEVERMPAAKILDFYRGLERAGARSRETETHETANGARYVRRDVREAAAG